MQGSRWFRKLKKECRKISKHIRIQHIKHGFYRVYWKGIYICELFKEMPLFGYDHIDNERRFEERDFIEKMEDPAELTRKIKNFVEGYVQSLDTIRTRVWLMKHSKEHYDTAYKGSQHLRVK